ncbi:MAG TPA: rhomboid family intramembrane serine protease [Chitinophaga sp.]|uniref:rhomboid family intramembrane serine protease n=1 Tax=Chitinophaga sp. TaxID=1869181 RepID=UPI002CF94F75|nr:rhomboid family intramembrane serine protease [Chitinophaga sp.]HVI43667.1 rhomboid family intramembrane serine protease [Chitinophaga sp.]
MHALEKEKLPHLSLGEGRNMVTQLIVVNLTIFVFLLFTLVIYKMENVGEPRFYEDIMSRLRIPADPSRLLVRPWTLITALFTHVEVWQTFTNMVWLWCFGTFLQHIAGYQRILPVYLFGGFIGNVFYVAGIQAIPALHTLIPAGTISGSSPSIMAMAAGATLIAPRYRIFPLLAGGIPLWIITILYVGLSIGTSVSSLNGAAYLLQLVGGALAGLLFMWQWKKGNDWGAAFNRLTFKLTHVFHPASQQINPDDLTKNLAGAGESHPFKRIGKVPEQRLNEILDKINENGLSSLTPEEKETLLRASSTD